MIILDEKKFKELQKEIRDEREGKGNRTLSEILDEMKKYVVFEELSESKKKDQEVETIIDKFASKYEYKMKGNATATFTEGLCYYFAIILKKIFKEEAKIYITSISGIHAIIKIGDNFYDINGNIKRDFDRNGEFRNKIDPSKYYEPDEDDFLYFCSICKIGRDLEILKQIENKCDEFAEEIIDELNAKKIK